MAIMRHSIDMLILFFNYFVLTILLDLKKVDAYENLKRGPKGSAIEFRTVLINCESDWETFPADMDSEKTRFQREELVKHNALRDCSKKIAVTVKITSDPQGAMSDDYIPIEHVYEGPDKKRIRLLNPYVLRMRRNRPREAYKLHKIDTVTAIFTELGDYEANRNEKKSVNWESALRSEGPQHKQTCPKKVTKDAELVDQITSSEKDRNVHIDFDKSFEKRNIDQRFGSSNFRIQSDLPIYKRVRPKNPDMIDEYFESQTPHYKYDVQKNIDNNLGIGNSEDYSTQEDVFKKDQLHKISNQTVKTYDNPYNTTIVKQLMEPNSNIKPFPDLDLPIRLVEKLVHVYKIADPDILYNINVKLYSKTTTTDGKTFWNDLTKGETASLSPHFPEWASQDLNVRYKLCDWLNNRDYEFTRKDFCLLLPVVEKTSAEIYEPFKDNSTLNTDNADDFMIVPIEDIEELKAVNKFGDENVTSNNNQHFQEGRQVKVRTSKAIFGNNKDFEIIKQGSNHYLTLSDFVPHRIQIDLEARADDNQIINVGSSGRIATVVSDSTNERRSALTTQISNTGLAAARFRLTIRDCGADLSTLLNKYKEETTTAPALIPPMHSKRLRLNLAMETSVENVHCTLALVNDDNNTIAVRGVVIKKGDRCFCVWHCDCVCLGEDPKLLCRELTRPLQEAAGLMNQNRVRHARSTCYADVIYINLFVVCVGVVLTILVLGMIKALMGLVSKDVGSWGLDQILQCPRRLDHYYETSLRHKNVKYDDCGWPVHPDTNKRTVRLVSRPVEFVLNLLFFVILPSIVIWNSIRKIFSLFKASFKRDECSSKKDVYSTPDLQAGFEVRRKRRRAVLQRWMSPQAEELTRSLIANGISPSQFCNMRPLNINKITKKEMASPINSDTEYILEQMQNSRESLARYQRQGRNK